MPRVAIVVLGVVAIALAGCGGGKAPAPVAGDEKAATAFLALIREGKVDAAWAATSTEFKSFMGKAEFAQYVRKHPALKSPAEFQSLTSQAEQVPPLVVCTYRTTGAKPAAVTVTLWWENDAWAVGKLTVE